MKTTFNNPAMPPIMDIEASGFGKNSYPIEIGYVLEDGQSYCTLIQPLDDWNEWSDEVESVHGITRDVLEEYGKPPAEVASQLNKALNGKILYTDAWSFDSSWLSLLFYSVDIPLDFKLESIRMIISEKQTEHWHFQKDIITASTNLQRHRASSDAFIIQQTYAKTFHMVNDGIR